LGGFAATKGEIMKLGSRRSIVGAMAMAYLLGIASASGQTGPEQKPLMAEDVFKNIQVLKGIPVDEFMGTMGFIAASLSMNCIDCHVTASASNVEKFAEDTPVKQTARRMILMVKAINAANFGGKREVTCYSCHRGDDRPKITPSLAEQYGTPPPEDPNEIEVSSQTRQGPSAAQIFDKYIQALGGAQRVANLTSFIAKGTYEGFDTESQKDPEVPAEVFAKAPEQRTTIVHLADGDSIRTYDGRVGWTTSAGTLLPVPVFALTGGDLDGAKLDAELSFPSQVKQLVSDWHVGSTTIGDHGVEVVQGTNAAGSPVKLYFDKTSGLLVRSVRYTNTPIGFNPTQIDYSDYREVSGVKIPFHWTVTWTDGQSTTQLTEVQPNVPIDAAKFAKPAPAPPPNLQHGNNP
jgi:photosynthetic reaction center cytochrome c subunit